MTKYLHTMIRVSSLEDSIAFFGLLGLREIRRRADEKGRYTNVFLAAPGDEALFVFTATFFSAISVTLMAHLR